MTSLDKTKLKDSKTTAVNGIVLVITTGKILFPIVAASGAYAAYRIDWPTVLRHFFLGPGKWGRIGMLIFSIINWKGMPFMWTYRIWKAVIMHSFVRSAPPCTPATLYAPIIAESRPSIFEIDYNLHKSNSTYFADLDVARSHLVSYILRQGMANAANNINTKIITDPSTGLPARGSFNICLGATHCSWNREIPPGKKYEVWTRVLSWDRKWFYMVTHYVPAGLGHPTSYLDPKASRLKNGNGTPKEGWEKKIYATAVSKYVFKLARLTIHPAILLETSGLLPKRPGGWERGELVDVPKDDVIAEEPVHPDGGDPDWWWVEWRRQEGMKYAKGFLKLDELTSYFDGGVGPAIGVFNPC